MAPAWGGRSGKPFGESISYKTSIRKRESRAKIPSDISKTL